MEKRKRLIYMDYYRAIIVFLMIQGHTLRALLSKNLKTGIWFNIHEFVHGAVAPGFLFLSGFLFYHTIKNKTFSDYLNKLSAYIGIIMIGYFLHLPFFSFKKTIEFWNTDIKSKLLQIDILQTIGFSLIISLLFWIILKNRFKFFTFFMIAFNLYILFSPFKVNNFFLSFFFDNKLSPFPLFPWSIYFFIGILANIYFKKFNFKLMLLAIILLSFQIFFGSIIIERIADIGKILFLLCLTQYFLDKDYKFFKHFLKASRESLFLYTSHIIIIYGSILNKGANYYFGDSLNFRYFLIILIILIIIVYSTAYIINLLKQKNIELFRFLKYSSYLLFLYFFFTRKW